MGGCAKFLNFNEFCLEPPKEDLKVRTDEDKNDFSLSFFSSDKHGIMSKS